MRILFAGTPAAAVPSLDAIVASEHEVVGVLTQADAPGKRGKKLVASPVAQRAAELGLPVFKPEKARDPEFVSQVEALRPDCCAVVAYGQLISTRLLAVPEHGWVNLHFSLLPRWRGAAPVQRAIMAGDEETGACVFELVPELDAGPVYDCLRAPVLPADTADDLLGRLAQQGSQLLVATLDRIGAGAQPHAQSADGVTLAPKLTVEECELDWQGQAEQLERKIRGSHSNPGAWTTFRGERFKVRLAAVAPDAPSLEPGELAATKRALYVGTGTLALELLRVQAFGKKEMAGADWARGVAIAARERFA